MRTMLIAALVAAATAPALAANYGSSANGGGSPGYNRGVATDYRLKKHHHVKKLHAQAAAPQAAKTTPGQAGGEAAKQPMGRP